MLNKTYSSIEETFFITVSMKHSYGYNTGRAIVSLNIIETLCRKISIAEY